MEPGLVAGRLRVDEGDLGYRLYPAAAEGATPIVLIAGWGSTMNDWFALPQELARHLGAPLLLFDHRGIGASHEHHGTISMDRLASDVLALSEALLPAVPFLALGHSAGGFVVQHLAIHAPERLAAAVFVGGQGARASAAAGSGEFFRLARWSLHRNDDLAARMAMMSYFWDPELCDAEGRDLRAMSLGSLQDKRPRATVEAQLKVLRKADLGPQLGLIKCPALVIHGRSDEVVPPENGGHLFRALTGSTVRRLALVDARHNPFAPDSAAARNIARIVAGFLRECRGAASNL